MLDRDCPHRVDCAVLSYVLEIIGPDNKMLAFAAS